MQWCIAGSVLQVDGQEEKMREERGVHHERDEIRGGETRLTEERRRDHGIARAQRDPRPGGRATVGQAHAAVHAQAGPQAPGQAEAQWLPIEPTG